MATRSTIAIELADGTVQQVYCHWDGYLDHNGKLLMNHYSDPLIAQELVNLGSISSLRETVGEKHSFDERYTNDDPKYNWTTAYHRDRGEDLDVHTFTNFEEYSKDHQYEEFEYILRKDGFWYVSSYGGDYQLLTDAIAEELREKALEEEDAE